MIEQFDAVFENGMLRPLQEVSLAENQHVRVRILAEPVSNGLEENESNTDPLEGLRVATGFSDLAERFDDYRFGRREP